MDNPPISAFNQHSTSFFDRSQTGQPLVSIITVDYRQLKVTCELLDSIAKLAYTNLQTIVVDNGSLADNTVTYQVHLPDVQVIVSKENLGFAGGNNLGIRQAKGDFIFLVNNDTVLSDGLIEALVARCQQPGVGAASPKIKYFDRPDTIQYAGFTQVNPLTGRNQAIGQGELDKGQHDQARLVPYAHGAAMMLRRETIERVGLMPEDFFLYYEDLDWCEQIRRENFQIWYEPIAFILHKESISTGKESPLKTEFLTRNRILFMRRNFHGWKLAAFLMFFCSISFPTHALKLLSQRNYRNLYALWRGMLNGLKHKNNQHERNRLHSIH
ncbi:MAG: glycosyltransferase family 2 protein [Saprospiraceae bacterium]|nr:glycosyltransferase family 2 protein [Saprospiraceae bacterium]